MHDIVFIFTGGTIDSYFDADKGSIVPHPRSIIPAYIEKRLFLDPRLRFEYIQLCAKDSRDITNADRQQMVQLIHEHPSDRFIITHGTFTLVDTAQFIVQHMPEKMSDRIILTGAMIPLDGYYHSDGHFNLGYAAGSIAQMESGVRVCIKGKCYSPDDAPRLHSAI